MEAVSRRDLLLAGSASLLLGNAPARRLLHRDDFRSGLRRWAIEAERGGRVSAARGVLDIDVPAGVTVWFREWLRGPVAIEATVTAVSGSGPNDQVSDVNFFWMARDPAAPGGDPLRRPRTGRFEDYDTLQTYYAGLGGNRNTSSRFRRYVGRVGERPLLPRHDLSAPADLLVPDRPTRIRLIADGRHIALYRDGHEMFVLEDPHPYTEGRFAFRTTWSHLKVSNFRVFRLP